MFHICDFFIKFNYGNNAIDKFTFILYQYTIIVILYRYIVNSILKIKGKKHFTITIQ